MIIDAEQAERIAELEDELNRVRLESIKRAEAWTDAIERAEAAEAELARTHAWARGRCECCFDGVTETEKTDEPCKSCRKGCNWSPAWAAEE